MNNQTIEETRMINFIQNWIDVKMKNFTDVQYGKGDFKKLLQDIQISIEARNMPELPN